MGNQNRGKAIGAAKYQGFGAINACWSCLRMRRVQVHRIRFGYCGYWGSLKEGVFKEVEKKRLVCSLFVEWYRFEEDCDAKVHKANILIIAHTCVLSMFYESSDQGNLRPRSIDPPSHSHHVRPLVAPSTTLFPCMKGVLVEPLKRTIR
ncbi:hypothetical protein JHK85_048357 [Glycine max]|nr:hypothetical protein JHK85_048357 [Glycine max]